MADSISNSTFLIASALLVSGYLLVRKTWSSKQRPFPPGPPSYPIIGQLLSIPQVTGGPEFAEPSAKLKSDIVSFTTFGTTIVVLNSAEVTRDLLDKRQNIYSGRFCPPMIVSPKLMDMQGFMVFLDNNELWRRHRRALSTRLNKQSALDFRPQQETQARALLQRLLRSCSTIESSEDLLLEFYWTVSGMFLDSVYGYELQSFDDPFFTDNITLNDHLGKAAMPSVFLVNTIPWLAHIPEWFPGAGWKKVAREWREQKNRCMNNVFYWAKQRVVEGVDDRSIIASTLKEARQMGENEDEADEFAKNLGTALLIAGTETSTLTLVWFVLAMALYPEVQTKAQQEIDAVVGSNRLPTFSDRPKLPYIERLLLEVLRWQPGIPLGAPHVCTEDNEYRGYLIPKGAIVLGNIWATTRQENTYPDAENFNPERFLDPKVPQPLAFGWGLRICPGQHFFREMFFIEVALILATFNIEKFKDGDGKVVEPMQKADTNSGISRPAEFKIRITPRSDQHAELIHTAA
ncbi:cytochrome P450 [Rhizoctonia solani]|nr:cytochrome P450 [Rhizoctonia solani]